MSPDRRARVHKLIDQRDGLVTELADLFQRVLMTRASAYGALLEQLDAHAGADEEPQNRETITDEAGEALAATLETDVAALIDVRDRALAALEAS